MGLDVFAGLAGVLLGWLLNWLPTWWSGRPRVKVQLVQLLTFPAVLRAGRWLQVTPDETPEAVMFWVVDLIVQNQSADDDAVTEIRFDMQPTRWASTAVGRKFFGQNLGRHSLHHFHLVFDFESVNFRTSQAWLRDRAVTLRLSTMNGQALSLLLDPAGTGVAMGSDDMTALVGV